MISNAQLDDATATCPGLHEGPKLPPVIEEIFEATAICDECGTASRVCRAQACGGRTRAGGLFCRICGEPLRPEWRRQFWGSLDRETVLLDLQVARSLRQRATRGRVEVRLVATDAWVAASLGRQVLLLEPGPGLLGFGEVQLEPAEVLIDIDVWHWPQLDRATWRMTTTRRLLRFDPISRHAETGNWPEAERFSESRGELLWKSKEVFCFHRPGGGTSVWTTDGKAPLFETADVLPHPAWLDQRQFVCSGRDELIVASVDGEGRPLRLPAPELFAQHPPLYDKATERVYVSGESAVHWWQRGAKRFIPFLPAGGAAVLRAPRGVVILEGDRLRIVSHEEHLLWDSRAVMPDFAPAALPWDHVGEALLVPTAARGAGTQLLLADLKTPGLVWRTELEGVLPCEPRLAPGGIVAARRGEDGTNLDLVWIGLGRRLDRER